MEEELLWWYITTYGFLSDQWDPFPLDKRKNKREHTEKIVLMFSTNIVPENKEKTRINRD